LSFLSAAVQLCIVYRCDWKLQHRHHLVTDNSSPVHLET
jgi:hypothetical protein